MRAVLLVFLAAALPAAADRCASPESVWDFRDLSDPQIHPSGQSVAFVLSWNDPLTDTAYTNIWLASLQGRSTPHPLTTGKVRHSSPRWSPDGKSLAYLAGGALKIRNMATGVERTLAEGASTPVWSPDGNWLAFFRFVPAQPKWDPPMSAKPAGARWASPARVVTELRWTFDGQGIAAPGETRLFVVPAAGGAPHQITSGDYHHSSYLHEPQVAWTASSDALLTPVVSAPDGWANYWGGDIYSFPRAGGEPRRLTNVMGTEASLAVAANGTSAAYSGFVFRKQGYHVSSLYHLNVATGESRHLTPSHDRDVLNPFWSSDAASLYFLSEDRGDTHLFRSDLQGKTEQITTGAMRLSSVSANRGHAVAIRSTATQPPHLVRFSLDAPGQLSTVFDPNTALLRQCRFSDIEELSYQSFDGAKIQGWLLKPPDFDPARKYPLLVSIHGGPHSMYGVNFQHEMRVQAGAGYVILYTNPRGSTGYGEKFANIIQYKWPGDDIRDILAGVDEAARRPYIDGGRAVVFGGSGGGLMTTWMVTQTNRFKAAVALYPVTNWFSHIGSDDNGMFVGSLYRRGWQWEKPDDYIERSPIFHVQKVSTPTMIITGEEDWRTPIAQSEEFYRALKIRGVDTVFVRVPGEPHGIRKHPSHRIAVLVHTLAWMQKYAPSK
ncbi:MAG: S9 family peptidase [Bryobacterales bacterium]|nr:S9 family peptidase [Bryobacterales bacterium]